MLEGTAPRKRGAMKRFIVVIALLVTLCACSENESNKHDELFQYYMVQDELSARVTATVQSGDRAAAFVFEMIRSGDVTTMTLVSPVEIEGISITLDANGAVVGYEGVSIELGVLGSASPAEMLPRLVRLWSCGEAYETGSEKIDDTETLRASWSDGGYDWTTWFAADGFAPLYGEVIRDGVRVMWFDFG